MRALIESSNITDHGSHSRLTEEAILNAEVTAKSGGPTSRIDVTLAKDGAEIFAKITRGNVGRRLAIVINGKAGSVPVIRSPILGGKTLIDGDFSRQEADGIAEKLNSYVAREYR